MGELYPEQDTAPIEMRCRMCGQEVRPIDAALPPPDHVMLDHCMQSTWWTPADNEKPDRPYWAFCAHPDVRTLARIVPLLRTLSE